MFSHKLQVHKPPPQPVREPKIKQFLFVLLIVKRLDFSILKEK